MVRPLVATALLRAGSRAARGGTALLGPEALVKLGLRPGLGARDGRRTVCLEVAGLRSGLEMLRLRPLAPRLSALRSLCERAKAVILPTGPGRAIRPHRRRVARGGGVVRG